MLRKFSTSLVVYTPPFQVWVSLSIQHRPYSPVTGSWSTAHSPAMSVGFPRTCAVIFCAGALSSSSFLASAAASFPLRSVTICWNRPYRAMDAPSSTGLPLAVPSLLRICTRFTRLSTLSVAVRLMRLDPGRSARVRSPCFFSITSSASPRNRTIYRPPVAADAWVYAVWMIWYRLTPGKFRLIAVPVRARLPTVSPKSAATRPVMPSGVWPRKRYAPWFRFKYSPRSAQDTSTVLDSVSRCRENTKPSKSSVSPR